MINLYINIYTHQQSLLSINARLQCQVTFYGSCLCHISTYNGRTNSSPQQPVHRCRYLISSMNNWSRVHLSYRYLVSRSTYFASVLIHRTEQKLVLSNKQKNNCVLHQHIIILSQFEGNKFSIRNSTHKISGLNFPPTR